MSWLRNPIRRGVEEGLRSGLQQGLKDALGAESAAAAIKPVPPMPAGLPGRIRWAVDLHRDAKLRANDAGPALGRLVAAGELRILTKLLIGWDAERQAAQGMETEGGDAKQAPGDSLTARSRSDAPKD